MCIFFMAQVIPLVGILDPKNFSHRQKLLPLVQMVRIHSLFVCKCVLVHIFMEDRGDHRCSQSVVLHIAYWAGSLAGLSSVIQLGWVANGPQESTCLHLCVTWIFTAYHHGFFFLKKTLALGTNSGLHKYTLSTFLTKLEFFNSGYVFHHCAIFHTLAVLLFAQLELIRMIHLRFTFFVVTWISGVSF